MGSIIYGCKGLESGALMHRYKQPHATQADLRLVGAVTAVGLGHRGCADALVGIPCRNWATVPSLKNVGAEHPFHRILVALLGDDSEVTVTSNGSSRRATDAQRRELQPGFYDVLTPVPEGSHVMVIDDTWTTGGHALSVAKALKRAGAGKVSILAVARWLDPGGGYPKWTYTNRIRDRGYDPLVCPWTAATCPPPLPAPSEAPLLTNPTPIPWPGFSWDAPGRIAPACRMIVDILRDGGWHRCSDITERVARAFELKPETVSKLLQGMVNEGGIARRGPSGRRLRVGADTREVRLR
ncbi:MAG: hypothetical protein WBO08_17940 [Mycobacterium sp.]|nr:hypothetical protein [Mycobacterium sp.]